MPEATNDSLALIKAVAHGVASTWREQGQRPERYSKAGVITTDLVPLAESPRALIGRLDRERSGPLMAALDACNARWGPGIRRPRPRRSRDAACVEHQVRDAHAALHDAGIGFPVACA